MTQQEAEQVLRQAYDGVEKVILVEHGLDENWAKVRVVISGGWPVEGWLNRHSPHETIWEDASYEPYPIN